MPIPKLGVNIDHVATIRQARRTFEPDPVTAAAMATLAGAEVITGHLRADRRHLNDRDLSLLKETVFSKLNLEMGATPAIVNIACKIKPEQVTLVPEKRAEITTEGGLDVLKGGRKLAQVVERLKKKGIIVSLFIDPTPDQIQASADIGVQAVELHTGPYANARKERAVNRELSTLIKAGELVESLGLALNAGHGLTYQNIRGIVEHLDIEELHIGHSIISRAVLVGMERAVREMCELIARYSALV
jgi:pyridoxine 5-phosphate synthase